MDNTDINTDEIDLIDLIRNILKQKVLIVIIMTICILTVLIIQISKLAFYAPKRVNYPIAIEFISDNNRNYPNHTPFSINDIISPTNIKLSISRLSLDKELDEVRSALSIDSSNLLIDKLEERLLDELNKKKQPAEIVEKTNKALLDLKRMSATYVTLKLNLEESHLSADKGKQLLKVLVDEWAKSSIDKGLIIPDIAYPRMPFKLSESIGIIANYDHLAKYASMLMRSLEKVDQLNGAKSIQVEGYSISDLKNDMKNIVYKDIDTMRAYGYSQSNLLAEDNPLVKANIFSQKRVLELKKNELEKRIASYNELVAVVGNSDKTPANIGTISSSNSLSPQIESGFLRELLDLGSKVSAVELKKDLIERQIKASEELFALETEIAVISGVDSDTREISPTQRKILALLPAVLERSVAKVNNVQNIFSRMVREYSQMSLQKSIKLYSAIEQPSVSNKFGLPLKRTIMMLLIGAFLGLILGVMIVLIRMMVRKNN